MKVRLLAITIIPLLFLIDCSSSKSKPIDLKIPQYVMVKH